MKNQKDILMAIETFEAMNKQYQEQINYADNEISEKTYKGIIDENKVRINILKWVLKKD